jgi:WD40 repeat protein
MTTVSSVINSDTPSVVDRTRLVDARSPVVSAHFLNDTAVFVLGEQELLFVSAAGEEQRVAAHGGGILHSTLAGGRIITGGDDGKVVATGERGESETIVRDAKYRWIDRVAAGRDGALAWSAGKEAFVRDGKGKEKTIEVASTVGGLAFAPKGLRLAIAHYNGVTLWFPNAQAKPEELEWKGSHLAASFSPDGRFIVTAMQEPTLHGWRLVDAKHMRMSGYSARVRSFDWTADGKWLATAGSEQLILWPFQSKDGPMGKTPTMYAAFQVRVAVVACHPKRDAVAVGYADGTLLLVRIDDGAEVLGKKPGGGTVSALAWNASGTLLAWGTEDGQAGVVSLA